ncbi:MAG: GDP-mannose 4,6-dehydratase [Promethearchaeota archaeon]
MKKTVIITGVTGQDGSYLSEFLLEKDYQVYGLIRRSSTDTCERIEGVLRGHNFELIEGDLCDATGINRIIAQIQPDECYNLAAMSFVGTSFAEPVSTFTVNAIGPLNILEAIRQNSPKTKFYQASTSELFGDTKTCPQNENTPFVPSSPYGISKLAGHHAARMYREAYGIFSCCGILFNHESPRRGNEFVTKKITNYIELLHKASQYSYKLDKQWTLNCDHNVGLKKIGKLKLGNINAQRDFGYAPEYVQCMWKMLQRDEPEDFVIATGETHTIREFLDHAFGCINIDDWSDYVEIDPRFYRPADVNLLLGDASKAKRVLNWKPRVKFEELVRLMVEEDLN